MRTLLVDTPEGFSALLAELRDLERFALDIEGDGLFRYRPRVCTLQVRAGDTIAVVDTLAVWDQEAMQALLGPTGPRKVVHDVAFDARLLWDHGVQVGNVFDTAIAARFLSEPVTGLASLLAKRCGVRIEKDQQQSDWGKRPLSEDAFRYLRDDVEHLVSLADSLEADLRRLDIEQEFEVECDYTLSQACMPPAPTKPPWLRIKGARRLPPIQRGVLREVALVREQAARDWDVPPFKVLHNHVLLNIAAKQPRSTADLARVRGFSKGRAKSLAQAFLAAVERGKASGDAPPEERSEPDAVRAGARAQAKLRKQREKALQTWRAQEACARGVDPQVVLPGHGLQDLARKAPGNEVALREIAGLGAVRIERYAAQWLALVAGAGAPVEQGESA